MSATTDRSANLSRAANESFDLVVVGGGATGLGVALDGVLRGLRVALFESHDFAKGTSSRATKLVHGGVRYLAQGRIGLVRESLRERSILLRNAKGLVQPLPFILPAYRTWELPFYAAGLTAYDALAGRSGLGTTRLLSAKTVQRRMPGVQQQGLKGGVLYWDAQFDDANLALSLARAAAGQGALMLNYTPVTGLLYDKERVSGVQVQDAETGRQMRVQARCVINATGVWADKLRHRDAAAGGRTTSPLVRASRGTHLVVDRAFFPSDAALIVPRTADGRVLFIIPWHGKVLLGTTDVATNELAREPRADPAEVDYILAEAARYLSTPPGRQHVKSVWAGLRPLVDPHNGNRNTKTREISREHTIEVSPSKLVTVTGGKWTTYRAMAQDVVETCVRSGLLPMLPACRTHEFTLPASERSSGLSADFVRQAVRNEYARTVEDVLARRSRLLFLDATLAEQSAPEVARVLQSETGHDAGLEPFLELARRYQITDYY